MKTIQHFIVTKTEKNRLYTLTIFEVVKKGCITLVGDITCSYGSHKGETSEAYTKLKELNNIKPSILKTISAAQKSRNSVSGNYESYYFYDFDEKFGLKIELL